MAEAGHYMSWGQHEQRAQHIRGMPMHNPATGEKSYKMACENRSEIENLRLIVEGLECPTEKPLDVSG